MRAFGSRNSAYAFLDTTDIHTDIPKSRLNTPVWGSLHSPNWPAELRAILRDEALQAFLATPRGESYDYEEVKKAILTRAGVSTTARVQQTFSFTPSTTRTASQVFADIKDTWTDFSRGMKTIEEFIEALSLECV